MKDGSECYLAISHLARSAFLRSLATTRIRKRKAYESKLTYAYVHIPYRGTRLYIYPGRFIYGVHCNCKINCLCVVRRIGRRHPETSPTNPYDLDEWKSECVLILIFTRIAWIFMVCVERNKNNSQFIIIILWDSIIKRDDCCLRYIWRENIVKENRRKGHKVATMKTLKSLPFDVLHEPPTLRKVSDVLVWMNDDVTIRRAFHANRYNTARLWVI